MTGSTSFNDKARLLAPEALTERLGNTLPNFGLVQWVHTTGSTNDDLSQRIKLGTAPSIPWLLGAHTQHTARGRAARPWQNTAGDTLMFSCAFNPNIPLAQLPGLSPALGVATCLALRELFALRLGAFACQKLALKWPNDLQWGSAKLAGILVETAQQPGVRHPCVIIGIGLNLRGAQALSKQLQREIADVSDIMACAQTPLANNNVGLCASEIVSTIAQAWQKALDVYATTGYAAFQDLFHSVDVLASQSVQVVDHGRVLHIGIAQGRVGIGRLLVQTEAAVVPVLVGDVSIKRPPTTEPTAILKGAP